MGKQGRLKTNGVVLAKHEAENAELFLDLGYNVELIPPARQRKKKTADAIINDVEWEFKTPRGSSAHTIQHIFKKAAKQSPNLIVDLRHMKLPQGLVIRRLKFEFKHCKTIKKLKAILNDRKIIDV